MSFIRCDVVVVSCSSQFIITFNQYKTIFNMEIATLHLFFYVDPIFKIHIHKMLYYLLANKMRSNNHEKMHGGRIVILLCHLEFIFIFMFIFVERSCNKRVDYVVQNKQNVSTNSKSSHCTDNVYLLTHVILLIFNCLSYFLTLFWPIFI